MNQITVRVFLFLLMALTPVGSATAAPDRPVTETAAAVVDVPWSTEIDYNLDHQLERVTRPDGLELIPSYDGAGRLDAVTVPHGAFDYRYDAQTGHLVAIDTPEPDGHLGFEWNGPLLETTTFGDPAAGLPWGTLEHAYDDSFRLASLRVNGDRDLELSFAYDRDDLLTEVGIGTPDELAVAAGAPSGCDAGQELGCLRLTYDAETGFLVGTVLGATEERYDYSVFGELERYRVYHGNGGCSGPCPSDRVYDLHIPPGVLGRDKLGRIVRKEETFFDPATGAVVSSAAYAYAYDDTGRLTRVERDDPAGGPPIEVAHYFYDDNGNRTSWSDPLGAGTADHDDQDRLERYDDTAFTYTAAGELAIETHDSGGAVEFDYDVLGNLRQVRQHDGTVVAYRTDGLDRRIGKTVNGELVRRWLYQDGLNPVAELDGSGQVRSLFVYAAKAYVPDAIVQGDRVFRVVSDHLGSVRLVIDVDTGEIALRRDYDTFGHIVYQAGSHPDPHLQPFGFAGGLHDTQTGLIRFGARDYQPRTGRWTAKDPIGFAAGDSNLYAYAGADPVNFLDPGGRLRLRNGSPEQQFLSSRLEHDLQSALRPATVAFFRENYDVDLNLVLSPGSGPLVYLDHEWNRPPRGVHGQYERDAIYLNLNDGLLEDELLFQATLLHEVLHWAADQASWLGFKSAELSPELLEEVNETRRSFKNPSLFQHAPDGWAVEIIQFDRIITLSDTPP